MDITKYVTSSKENGNTGNSGYIHWNGGGYIETVDMTKYVASSKENGNTGNSGYIHWNGGGYIETGITKYVTRIYRSLDISTETGVDISKQWILRNTSLVLKKMGIQVTLDISTGTGVDISKQWI